MHKTSSLSELGFDAGSASSAFFRPVADSSPLTPTASNRRLIKVSVIPAYHSFDEAALEGIRLGFDAGSASSAFFCPVADSSPLTPTAANGRLTKVSVIPAYHSFDEAALEGIRRAVVGGAYEVIGLKGYTSWAFSYSVASLAASMLRDQRCVHSVSVLASGFHGISDGHDVFLSLPAWLGHGGVLGVAEMDLTEAEAAQLRRSTKTLWENYQLLGL